MYAYILMGMTDDFWVVVAGIYVMIMAGIFVGAVAAEGLVALVRFLWRHRDD